ncbi:MAG: HAD-IB family phosphatase [Thermoplasmata archaeon]|nr:MAG: HAD-IB family phosphatase [Thermoplasmata archaeon]
MDRRYKIVIFDLDGVLAEATSSWGYIHDFFGVSNEKNLMEYFERRIDDIEFMRRDIAMWQMQEPDIGVERISEILGKIPLVPGALETLQEIKGRGFKIAIISGGLELLANRINELVPIDHIYANGLQHDGSGALSGEGILNVPLRHKEDVMLKLLEKLSLSPEECVAVGDSTVDAAMLKSAGLGIAFCPLDEEVKTCADIIIYEKDLQEILKYIL